MYLNTTSDALKGKAVYSVQEYLLRWWRGVEKQLCIFLLQENFCCWRLVNLWSWIQS